MSDVMIEEQEMVSGGRKRDEGTRKREERSYSMSCILYACLVSYVTASLRPCVPASLRHARLRPCVPASLRQCTCAEVDAEERR